MNNNCNNESDPFTQEWINDIPEEFLFHLTIQNITSCYDIRKLINWIRVNPSDPFTRQFFSFDTIMAIINRANQLELSDVPTISDINLESVRPFEHELELPAEPLDNLVEDQEEDYEEDYEEEFNSDEYDFSHEEARHEMIQYQANLENLRLAENIASIYVPPETYTCAIFYPESMAANNISTVELQPNMTLLDVINDVIDRTGAYQYNRIGLYLWPWKLADGSYRPPAIRTEFRETQFQYSMNGLNDANPDLFLRIVDPKFSKIIKVYGNNYYFSVPLGTEACIMLFT
jgi:hypothetical protein